MYVVIPSYLIPFFFYIYFGISEGFTIVLMIIFGNILYKLASAHALSSYTSSGFRSLLFSEQKTESAKACFRVTLSTFLTDNEIQKVLKEYEEGKMTVGVTGSYASKARAFVLTIMMLITSVFAVEFLYLMHPELSITIENLIPSFNMAFNNMLYEHFYKYLIMYQLCIFMEHYVQNRDEDRLDLYIKFCIEQTPTRRKVIKDGLAAENG